MPLTRVPVFNFFPKQFCRETSRAIPITPCLHYLKVILAYSFKHQPPNTAPGSPLKNEPERASGPLGRHLLEQAGESLRDLGDTNEPRKRGPRRPRSGRNIHDGQPPPLAVAQVVLGKEPPLPRPIRGQMSADQILTVPVVVMGVPGVACGTCPASRGPGRCWGRLCGGPGAVDEDQLVVDSAVCRPRPSLVYAGDCLYQAPEGKQEMKLFIEALFLAGSLLQHETYPETVDVEDLWQTLEGKGWQVSRMRG